MVNGNGLRIDPLGTPDVTDVIEEDEMLLRTTLSSASEVVLDPG